MSSVPQDPYRPVGEAYLPPTTGGIVPETTAADQAKDAAASVAGPASEVKDTAVDAGREVVATAKAEATQVVQETKLQGRRLLDESVSELRSQASTAQSKLADTVQALSDELRAMASSPDANGPLAGLAASGQDVGERAAAWLRDNDLDQALAGVRRYAARNPWTFLAIAGGAGLLVGRLARGLKDADDPAEVYPPAEPDEAVYRPGTVGADRTWGDA